MTSICFLSKLLISLVLVTTTQYSSISAFSTHHPTNEFTTDSSTDVTEESPNADLTDRRLKLLKDLIAENSNADVFKDLQGVPDKEFTFESIPCFMEACSYRVTHISKSFVIKEHRYRALDATLAAKAVELEYKALVQRNQLQPGIVPQPYLLSLQYNCIVMEDFKDYVYLKSLLASGEISEEAINNITVSVIALHNTTFGKVDTLGQDFLSNELTDRVVRVKYFAMINNLTVERLINAGFNFTSMEKMSSPEFLDKISQLYTNISNKQAVLHGFLNGDNVIVRVEAVKLVGNQFTMAGPVAFDVGTLLGQYLISYHVHKANAEDNDAEHQISDKMVNASINLVDGYVAAMGPTVFDDEKSKEFVSAVAGYAGVELISRILNLIIARSTILITPDFSAILESGVRLIELSNSFNNGSSLVNAAINLKS